MEMMMIMEKKENILEDLKYLFKDGRKKEKFAKELKNNKNLRKICENMHPILFEVMDDIIDNYVPFFDYIKENDRENFEKIAIKYLKQSIKLDLLERNEKANFLNPAYENLLTELVRIFMTIFILYYNGYYLKEITTPHYLD